MKHLLSLVGQKEPVFRGKFIGIKAGYKASARVNPTQKEAYADLAKEKSAEAIAQTQASLADLSSEVLINQTNGFLYGTLWKLLHKESHTHIRQVKPGTADWPKMQAVVKALKDLTASGFNVNKFGPGDKAKINSAGKLVILSSSGAVKATSDDPIVSVDAADEDDEVLTEKEHSLSECMIEGKTPKLRQKSDGNFTFDTNGLSGSYSASGDTHAIEVSQTVGTKTEKITLEYKLVGETLTPQSAGSEKKITTKDAAGVEIFAEIFHFNGTDWVKEVKELTEAEKKFEEGWGKINLPQGLSWGETKNENTYSKRVLKAPSLNQNFPRLKYVVITLYLNDEGENYYEFVAVIEDISYGRIGNRTLSKTLPFHPDAKNVNDYLANDGLKNELSDLFEEQEEEKKTSELFSGLIEKLNKLNASNETGLKKISAEIKSKIPSGTIIKLDRVVVNTDNFEEKILGLYNDQKVLKINPYVSAKTVNNNGNKKLGIESIWFESKEKSAENSEEILTETYEQIRDFPIGYTKEPGTYDETIGYTFGIVSDKLSKGKEVIVNINEEQKIVLSFTGSVNNFRKEFSDAKEFNTYLKGTDLFQKDLENEGMLKSAEKDENQKKVEAIKKKLVSTDTVVPDSDFSEDAVVEIMMSDGSTAFKYPRDKATLHSIENIQRTASAGNGPRADESTIKIELDDNGKIKKLTYTVKKLKDAFSSRGDAEDSAEKEITFEELKKFLPKGETLAYGITEKNGKLSHDGKDKGIGLKEVSTDKYEVSFDKASGIGKIDRGNFVVEKSGGGYKVISGNKETYTKEDGKEKVIAKSQLSYDAKSKSWEWKPDTLGVEEGEISAGKIKLKGMSETVDVATHTFTQKSDKNLIKPGVTDRIILSEDGNEKGEIMRFGAGVKVRQTFRENSAENMSNRLSSGENEVVLFQHPAAFGEVGGSITGLHYKDGKWIEGPKSDQITSQGLCVIDKAGNLHIGTKAELKTKVDNGSINAESAFSQLLVAHDSDGDGVFDTIGEKYLNGKFADLAKAGNAHFLIDKRDGTKEVVIFDKKNGIERGAILSFLQEQKAKTVLYLDNFSGEADTWIRRYDKDGNPSNADIDTNNNTGSYLTFYVEKPKDNSSEK